MSGAVTCAKWSAALFALAGGAALGAWVVGEWPTGGTALPKIALAAVALALVLWHGVYLTEKQEAERALLESEERFRAIFDQAGVGVAQIALDGTIKLANDRYCAVLGCSREQLSGAGTGEMSIREDLDRQIEQMPRLLAGEIQSFSTEKRYQRKDGTVVWAQVWKSLVRDGGRRPQYFIAVIEDITGRKQAEAALKESEERFRNLADSAPVMIWMSDADRRCTFFNKRWLEFTGRRMEEELGDGWSAGVHPEDLKHCLETYVSAFDARRDFQMEYRLRRADGEYRCVMDRGTARFSPEGAFAGYIGSCIDITAMKRGYEQHLAMQKLESLGVLAAGVAHDFNNLLGAIAVHAESAKGELAAGSAAFEEVEQIHRTALRASEIVSEMTTFAADGDASAAEIELSALTAEMQQLLRLSISKMAELHTELAAGLPLLGGNAAEIRQVIMNLVVNASEALEGRPGSIVIATAAAQMDGSPAVRLEVRDTGSGMTEAVKARIFDPFFTTRFMGRGLGLAAVQGIVRRHGGRIEVESSPGAGSRFIVLLPASGGVANRPAQAARAPESTPANAGTVLFVEDEESLRSVVAKLLRKRGYQVLEAPDGEAALGLLEAEPGIATVLLDVTLPGISGVDLLDELHRLRPEIRVIVSTAYGWEAVRTEFAGRFIAGFIKKPYRIEELERFLRPALAGAGETAKAG